MRNSKIDINHRQIVDALRKAGCSVQSLAACGQGVPDLLVGYRGQNILIEVKNAKGKLTDHQIEWHAKWNGQVSIVRSVEDAIDVLEMITLN